MNKNTFVPDEIVEIRMAKDDVPRLLRKVERKRAEWKKTTTSYAKLSVAKRELNAIETRAISIIENFDMSEEEWWRGGARGDMIKDSRNRIEKGLSIVRLVIAKYSKKEKKGGTK